MTTGVTPSLTPDSGGGKVSDFQSPKTRSIYIVFTQIDATTIFFIFNNVFAYIEKQILKSNR